MNTGVGFPLKLKGTVRT